MVFWRLTGIKELEEDVEARDGACNIATDIRRMDCALDNDVLDDAR